MNELKEIKAIISDEYKGKMRFVNLEDESQYIEVPLEVSKISGDKWGSLLLEKLTGKKQPLPVELFDRSLNITDKQRIALYTDWGKTKAIMIKDVAMNLEISRDEAIAIVNLATKYHLLTRGHNNTWKVIDNTLQERWKDVAKALERGEKGLNYDMPSTPEESVERLNKMSTLEQKRIARGEKNIIIKEEEESPVEVVDENKLYSPAAQAKAKEKEEWEKSVKEGGKKALQSMNSVKQSLPKCIRVIQRNEVGSDPTLPGQGKIPTKKKPLSDKSVQKR